MRSHLFLIIAICMVLSACSNDSDKKSELELTGEHVWKAQTDALKQAQEVGALANDAVEKQRKVLEKLNNEQ